MRFNHSRAMLIFVNFLGINNVWEKKLDLHEFIEDLRYIVAGCLALRRESPKSSGYVASNVMYLATRTHCGSAGQDFKHAERALYPLLLKQKPVVTMEHIGPLIPQSMGRIRTILAEKVQTGKIRLLEDLDRMKRSIALLNRFPRSGATCAEAC